MKWEDSAPLWRITCIFCLGEKGELLDEDKKSTLTEKGFQSIYEASIARNDDVTSRVLYMRNNNKSCDVRFHKDCRRDYCCSKRVISAKKRKPEEDPSLLLAEEPDNLDTLPKRVSRKDTMIDWSRQCFFCGGGPDPKHKVTLTPVTIRPEEVLKKVRSAAEQRDDRKILTRLALEKDKSLSDKKAHYHKSCYSGYLSERNIAAARTQNKSKQRSLYDEVAKIIVDNNRERLINGEVLLFSQMCTHFRESLIEKGVASTDTTIIKNAYIRKKIENVDKQNFMFFDSSDTPTVFCSSAISISKLVVALKGLKDQENDDKNVECSDWDKNVKLIHKVVEIIRSEIDKIPATTAYPTPLEVLLTASKDFVPKSLKLLVTWLLDKTSFMKMDRNINSEFASHRRAITICECIIYSSRRFKNQVIPPFHMGLLLFLQHEIGSRKLIDILNACGFCAAYAEMRAFLTALAENELSKNETVYIPTGVMDFNDLGAILQEGDDNVDIPVVTFDGKNTYHRLARVILQCLPIRCSLPVSRIFRQEQKTLNIDVNTQDQFSILPFSKPTQKPEAPKFAGITEDITALIKVQDPCIDHKDILWVLMRAKSRGSVLSTVESEQKIPMWTGFNKAFFDPHDSVTVASYLPSLNATPSDMATIYTCLVKGSELAKECGQNFHIHTFDQQLYAVAQQVKFSNSTQFKNLVLRLGGFHSAATFISCIGKIWGAGGLRDMLVDSNVYAGNSVDNMLAGKQFHRVVRGLTLSFDALMQLLLESFVIWLKEKNKSEKLNEFLSKLNDCESSYAQKDMFRINFEKVESEFQTLVLPELIEFLNYGCAKSNTFKYWLNYLQAVDLLLNFIRAERQGDWDLHVQSQASMLPYYFVCDRQNYSRWASLYVSEMLKTLPPEVLTAFHEGQFAVRFSPSAFAGVWADMGVEMSVVRDEKSGAGITGFTQKESTVLRWTLTRHILGSYGKCMRIRCGLEEDPSEVSKKLENSPHEQESRSFLKRDEGHARDLISHIRNNMSNPFDLSLDKSLIHIGSGLLASEEVENSLMAFVDVGHKKLSSFLKNCIDSDSTTKKSFFDPITRLNIKTFKDMQTKSVAKVQGKLIKAVISAETVYQRAFTLSEVRPEINLKTILSYPLTAVPSSLFREDGIKRRTQKAEFIHVLESLIKEDVLPTNRVDLGQNSMHIVDAMADLHSIDYKKLKTFGDLGHIVLKRLLNRLTGSNEVHYIFDRYDSNIHPKNDERILRHKSGGHIYDIQSSRPLPDMSKIFSNNVNKANLTAFLSHFIETSAPMYLKQTPRKKILLGGGYSNLLLAKSISVEGTEEEIMFFCNHTEADTRMVYHAIVGCAENDVSNILVESPDTDVFLLFLGHYSKLPFNSKLWFLTGRITPTLDKRRCIPIHDLYLNLGSNLSSALLPFHAMTGCDTVSSLYGIGKKKVLKLAQKLNDNQLLGLLDLPNVLKDEKVLKNALMLTAMLYDPASKFSKHHHSLTEMRFAFARDLKRNSSIDRIPPSYPAFHEHIKRAAWQAHEWLNANKSKIPAMNPSDYGWKVDENELRPKYFDGQTSLDLLEDLFCACKGKAPCSNRCRCQMNGIECCEVCGCDGECTRPKLLDEDIIPETE